MNNANLVISDYQNKSNSVVVYFKDGSKKTFKNSNHFGFEKDFNCYYVSVNHLNNYEGVTSSKIYIDKNEVLLIGFEEAFKYMEDGYYYD